MALNTLKCNHLTPLGLKLLKPAGILLRWYICRNKWFYTFSILVFHMHCCF